MIPQSRTACAALVLACLNCASSGWAQRLSVGVVGGTSFTNDFSPRYSEAYPSIPTYRSARTGGFLAGLSLEYDLTERLSVEVNALNRPLYWNGRDVRPDGSILADSTAAVTNWQFPALVKYRLHTTGLTPFVEAGPSFRVLGNLGGDNPFHMGATAGAGVEWRARHWTLSPALRYTRWRQGSYDVDAKVDQLEGLITISHRSENNGRPFGQDVSFGVLLGTTLTSDFREKVFTGEIRPDDPFYPPGLATYRYLPGPRSVLAGPTLEWRWNRRLSVEASALYRRLRQKTEVTYSDGSVQSACCNSAGLAIWELPVLAKIALPGRTFVGAGPAFRTYGAGDDPHYGLALAAGLRTQWGGLRLAPQIRYTRWARNELRMKPADQVQVLIGVSF
ncbi:MAG: outer membrane beta-barrel protein [Acidobacteria bacterium]|nr:outer membrane beta-barrel protein [Acidobacteriota bacterium]